MGVMKKLSCSTTAARSAGVLVCVALLMLAGCTSVSTPVSRDSTVSTTDAAPTRAAPDPSSPDQAFTDWIARFSVRASAAGIDAATLHLAFDDVHFIPRVVELDRAQPEFTRAVWDYLDSAVSEQRITRGQEKLLQLRQQSTPLLHATAFPPKYWWPFGA